MSKIKNMSRAGWIVAGVVAALVLLPTVAVAASTVVNIKGSPSGNKADVTGAGQLLTTTANPNSFFQNTSDPLSSSGNQVATPPSGLALVVTTIHVDVFTVMTSGAGQFVEFFVATGTNCTTGSQVGSYDQVINPASVGGMDVSVEPGLGIPAGDSLCGAITGTLEAEASASGYTVPSSSVSSGPLHRVPAPPKQR